MREIFVVIMVALSGIGIFIVEGTITLWLFFVIFMINILDLIIMFHSPKNKQTLKDENE